MTTSAPPTTTTPEEVTIRNAILDQQSQNLQYSSTDSDSDTESVPDSHPTSHMPRQRHLQRRERINPSSVQTTIDLFIGALNNKNNWRHIQCHILTKAHVMVEKDKIVALPDSRNGKKNFKISVPHDKVERVLNIWKSPIRAEVYRGGPKSTLIEERGSTHNRNNRFKRTNSYRPNSNNRTNHTNNQRFHNNRTNSNRPNSNSRTNHTNNQRFHGQSNYYNRWSRPQMPTYSRQYWDRYDEPSVWYPQQYDRYYE